MNKSNGKTTTIELFLGPQVDDNKHAYQLLLKLDGVQIAVIGDLPQIGQYVPVPYLAMPNGARHYGLPSIRRFVEEELATAS